MEMISLFRNSIYLPFTDKCTSTTINKISLILQSRILDVGHLIFCCRFSFLGLVGPEQHDEACRATILLFLPQLEYVVDLQVELVTCLIPVLTLVGNKFPLNVLVE